jgi:lysophospholipase L1-like esterase
VEAWTPLDFSRPESLVDGDRSTLWGAGKPMPGRPAWVAIDVGTGPRRVLVVWSAAGSFNYTETDYGSPGAFRIETSADSDDGKDGSWTIAADVPRVSTHAGAHAFDFAGQRWVKVVVTAAPARSPNGVQLDRLDVYDISAGASDTWFFMGDSITAFAFGSSVAKGRGFATDVQRRHPGHYPAVINGGVGGDKADDGVRHIDAWLRKNPDARFWGIGYGSNDSAGDSRDTARFRKSMQKIIDRVRAAGHVPILARIPYSTDGNHSTIPEFNAVIDELQRGNSLPAGPDLYAYFRAHPEQLRDGLHPDERGIEAINRLWAAAVDPLYSRPAGR